MVLKRKDYFQKLLGCWMGKNIGGTLGDPFEWIRQVNNVSYYIQDLHGDPLANDDLDIQLLWLIAMEEQGVKIDSHILSDYWLLYLTPQWGEYGNSKLNMRSGLMPPLSGTFRNIYKDSCGSFIRSEIWACISAGFPEIAARYAFQDAIIDHGNGEGTYGEVFCAALESAAFVEKDLNTLIAIGLSYIPDNCGVANAVRNVLNCHKLGSTWLEARDDVLKNHCGLVDRISDEDVKKGFGLGKLGYHVPLNIAMVMIGLLYGEGDFGKSICMTVNCGEDTDCTAATLGSIWGILNGIDAIPDKWKKPIGRHIKTACLNIGPLGHYGDQLPATIDDLSVRVDRIFGKICLEYNLPAAQSEDKFIDVSKMEKLFATSDFCKIYDKMNYVEYRFTFFNVCIDYGGDPTIKTRIARKLRLIIENKYRVQEVVKITWTLPPGWSISPDRQTTIYVPSKGVEKHICELEYQLTAENVENLINRFTVEIGFDGRHSLMLVPVILLNGNMS